MALKVLGISASPRKGGNSEALLEQALNAIRDTNADIEKIRICDCNIGPCIACDMCHTTGTCPITDDFQPIMQKILEADRLIFATPVFWMNIPAQAKTLIDRTQCLWAKKNILRQSIPETQGRDRRAALIVVGGSKSKKMFECVGLTMKYWLEIIDMRHTANLFISEIDGKNDAAQNTKAMDQAARLGKELLRTDIPTPDKPVNIELT